MDMLKFEDGSACAILPATSSTASSPDGKLSSDSLSFDSHSDFFYETSIKKEYIDDAKMCYYEPAAPMQGDAVYSKDYGLPPYPGSNGKSDAVTILCENKAELPESSSSPPSHKAKPGRRSNHGQGKKSGQMLTITTER